MLGDSSMNKQVALQAAFIKVNKQAEPADVVDLEHKEPMLYQWQVQAILRELEEDLK